MSNDSTIPSQLGPADTVPSQLGPATGINRQRRPVKANPWPRYLMLALVAAACVYLLGQLAGR